MQACRPGVEVEHSNQMKFEYPTLMSSMYPLRTLQNSVVSLGGDLAERQHAPSTNNQLQAGYHQVTFEQGI